MAMIAPLRNADAVLSPPQAQMEKAARGFEQMFLDILWQESRKSAEVAGDEGSLFAKSHGERVFQGMLDHEYSGMMAQRGGLGLAEQIVEQLSGRGGVGGTGSHVQRPHGALALGGSVHRPVEPAQSLGDPQEISFTAPLEGAMSSAYGERHDPFTQEVRHHGGVDIAAPHGSAVGAAAEGVVAYAGKMGSYGQVVVLDHGHGYKSLYAHLSETGVAAGEPVKSGECIGKVGSSGRSTGPHLHFEVARNGAKLDPEQWLRPEGRRF